MSTLAEANLDSDSDDPDFVIEDDKQPSDSDLSDSDDGSDVNEIEANKTDTKKRKTKRQRKQRKRKKDTNDESAEIVSEEPPKEEQKKQEDDLWASFLSDVDTISKRKSAPAALGTDEDAPTKITEELNFAGKLITVEKTVTKGNNRLITEGVSVINGTDECSRVTADGKCNRAQSPPAMRRMRSTSVQQFIDNLKGKKKMTVLDKTKLDWSSYVKKEGIEEDLNNSNRGKNGYLDKKAFLLRVDHREAEGERSARDVVRNNRDLKKF